MNLVTAFPSSSAFASPARASRRIATRRDVLLPCQAVRESDFKLISDRTLDVSVDGLLLPVDEPILTGETLIVSFPIPGMWIDAECSVTRVVHGSRPQLAPRWPGFSTASRRRCRAVARSHASAAARRVRRSPTSRS